MQAIRLEEGLLIIEEAIQKTRKIVEGYPETKFTPEEYMKFHTCVYTLCYKPRDGNKELLFGVFKKSLEDTINSKVLPSLAAKQNEVLLRELVLMWSNYRIMARWLCRFFEYLDRYYTDSGCGVSLGETSIDCFGNLVFGVLNSRIQAAAISLINEERHGKKIDLKLLQDVTSIFIEISGKNYHHTIQTLSKLCLRKLPLSTINYLPSGCCMTRCLIIFRRFISDPNSSMVNWCMKQEKERAGHYLHPTSVLKLVQVLQCQLLDMNALKLVEKLQSQKGNKLDYQEILSKCACLNLGEENSTSTVGDLPDLME